MTARSACVCSAELVALRAAVADLELGIRECLSLLRVGPRSAEPAASLVASDFPSQRQPAQYQHLVDRLTAAVVDLVPTGSGVLVVSRGDDRLLSLDGRPAGHFPQTNAGQYAGHHPDDSATAIAELDRLVTAGWRYLVFPSTALWWLDHYSGLRRHLETTGRLLLRQDGLGVVYGLSACPDTDPSLLSLEPAS